MWSPHLWGHCYPLGSVATQIAKPLVSTSIKHRSDISESDRCLIDVDRNFYATEAHMRKHDQMPVLMPSITQILREVLFIYSIKFHSGFVLKFCTRHNHCQALYQLLNDWATVKRLLTSDFRRDLHLRLAVSSCSICALKWVLLLIWFNRD